MRRFFIYCRWFIFLIIPLTFFLVSCSESTDESSVFGNPPTPESCFCDPGGVKTYLEWISEKYPELTELRSIGVTESGREIYAIELSNHPGIAENEPKVLVNGSIHGNEQIAAGIPMKLIEYLLQGYLKNDTEAINLVNNFKLHFIPALNPDGLAAGQRYNSNYVDLNRNFSYTWDVDTAFNGKAAFDQAESQAVQNDFSANSYALSINLHTSENQTNIGIYGPWDAIESDYPDFTTEYLPNYAFIESKGEAYALRLNTTGTYPFTPYFHYQEGADWYPFCGSMADWALGIHGTLTYTIELYGDQNFSVSDTGILEQTWSAHKSALLELITTAGLGSGGFVTDSSGNVITGAVITLSASGSRLYTPQPYSELKSVSDTDGLFRLLTGNGTYNLTIEKNGYKTFTAALGVDENGRTSVNGENYQFVPEYILVE